MISAAFVVALDHRSAIRDLDIGFRNVLARWKSYTLLAEKLIVRDKNLK